MARVCMTQGQHAAWKLCAPGAQLPDTVHLPSLPQVAVGAPVRPAAHVPLHVAPSCLPLHAALQVALPPAGTLLHCTTAVHVHAAAAFTW